MGQLSPMMQNYIKTKEEYNDCILFYRLGDFYEMFFDDAKLASKELELALTGKSCGLEERAPMCGVPFHSADIYIHKLVGKGYKVAICEQVEDPKEAKGLVRREVIRIVTPGTENLPSSLEDDKNNFLMCIIADMAGYGLSVCDVSTGEFHISFTSGDNSLLDEIGRYSPAEIICNDAFFRSGIDISDLKNRLNITISVLDPSFLSQDSCEHIIKSHFHVVTTQGLGVDDIPLGTVSAGCILRYMVETQKCELSHITNIQVDKNGQRMLLDRNTRRNLELVETMREKSKKGSLLWVLDKTKTAMGARMLRASIERPLLDEKEITGRYDAIEEMNTDPVTREELREYLGPVYDLERLISRISYQTINPRDMLSLGSSLEILPSIYEICSGYDNDLMKSLCSDFDTLKDLADLISASIDEDAPLSLKDGGILKTGYNADVDRLRNAKAKGKEWMVELVAKESERTGIKNLKLNYNKVFGYYLEVTKSFISKVPDDWTRKQTLANAERYTTAELKEIEDETLGAQDRLYQLEYDIFCDIRDTVSKHIERIQKTSHVIAAIDMMASLAYVAEHENYVRPGIRKDGALEIRKGRHPVIEKMIEHDLFVANDTRLDLDSDRIAIITGPNMAGKSTYMRQTALIQLMAQIGSFVPAESADLSIVDRIFTRVGASDDLSSGQSTFMVEMTEVANILHNATRNSLVILDEIGRGTSTYDGLSIAWAVVEYISDISKIGAKTLFATHYHELTELEDSLDGVKNYCIAVREDGDEIVFLRKIIRGGADRSYGIQVAGLAGVPEEVLFRAKEISGVLSDNDNAANLRLIQNDGKKGDISPRPIDVQGGAGASEIHKQLSIFDALGDESEMDDILCEIRDTDLSNITPIDAINLVNKWQKQIEDKW
ncbi:MAG: DNA mismatch repair protein MutS [Eubacterium sp.]|nr:DNA mismatch repair protein MutS [Eubacterium sp.]